MTHADQQTIHLPAEEQVRFCQRCGAPMAWEPRFGRLRPVCSVCEWVFFPDPKVAAAVLVDREGEVLLVRRVNDPERGKWSLPAGFVDAGEDPARAAERECLEETGLIVKAGEVIDVLYGLEHPRGAHIVIFYKAVILSGEMIPADDVDEVRFFSRQNLPELAFQTTKKILSLQI